MARGLSAQLIILGLFVKLLLFPAYHSTDFDVHRNWLAITHNLPLSKWYHEATSEWTLDYPPFFAYFEYLLSQLVPNKVIEDGCLRIVAADGQYGWPTVVYQRLSVLATELVFAYALHIVCEPKIATLLWLCPAWLILDHMHFQYNTAMFGIFIFALGFMIKKQYLKSAFTFSSLLCFKHIYLYVAPVFFVGLLWQYILGGMQHGEIQIGKFLDRGVKLGIATILPFVAAFGPFIYDEFANGHDGLMIQILSRLFPFSRGLTHSYWAPNFWTLYSFADRVLGVYNKNSVASATRGIVGQVEFSNLPEITPSITFMVTLAFQLLSTLRAGTIGSLKFVEAITLCGFSAFLFGWHVHEKAIMIVTVPFAIVANKSSKHARAFMPLLASSCFSLFPLIWTGEESVLKSVYSWAYIIVAFITLPISNSGPGVLNWLYLLGFALVMPAYALLPMIIPKYEYSGLMLVSVYSSLGVFWSWLQLNWLYFRYL